MIDEIENLISDIDFNNMTDFKEKIEDIKKFKDDERLNLEERIWLSGWLNGAEKILNNYENERM
ncbi:hypothetical protein QTI99_16195 [Clostridium perfringens]|uniref:hypothetical protein n=1 Tax=Clostridium perfringens TaxID=1502 RepID=UPI002A1E65B1|nr:hypothetical protein [Clostridium perfringens]MDM0998994.1 hypothetical protein [Clostridium perfringens]WVM77725.1 hypothetical protein V1680_16760 [Clostridium perfringens]